MTEKGRPTTARRGKRGKLARRVLLVMALVYAGLFAWLGINGVFRDPFLAGDHTVVGSFHNSIPFPWQMQGTLDAAVARAPEMNGEVVHQCAVANYHIVFYHWGTQYGDQKEYSVATQEFATDRGYFANTGSAQVTVCSGPEQYGAYSTVQAELGIYLNNTFRRFLNLQKRYGALPAWGVAHGEWVEAMRVEGQSPDEIIPLPDGLSLWIYHDLQTDRNAADVRMENVPE